MRKLAWTQCAALALVLGAGCAGEGVTVSPVCGDGTCSDGESEGTCCQDCGCGEGNECGVPTCGVTGCATSAFPEGTPCTDGTCDGAGMCHVPVCGDGTCDQDFDEDVETCCEDCGCAEGSSCAEGACVVNPVCGDGTCNGTETEASCCTDCGCAEGSTCTDGACVVDPVCGDGTCNGTETEASCCTDCGCGDGALYACESNACVCAHVTLRYVNVAPDRVVQCASTGLAYTQQSVAYVSFLSGAPGFTVRPGAPVDVASTLDHGISVGVRCCFLDGCIGTSTCNTPNGPVGCVCGSFQNRSVTPLVCGTTGVPLCN
jgi:hypothetical protein